MKKPSIELYLDTLNTSSKEIIRDLGDGLFEMKYNKIEAILMKNSLNLKHNEIKDLHLTKKVIYILTNKEMWKDRLDYAKYNFKNLFY